jgi:anaerobic selenocysteine-containing dehydrogenase
MKRRDFLKVLGAGGAAATAGCTTGEVERLIPYVVPSEDVVPGVATWYTSTCRECPAGCGIHVETHSGRATKVEGNPEHPVSHGNLCARGQASVQGLYHPDRFRGPVTR